MRPSYRMQRGSGHTIVNPKITGSSTVHIGDRYELVPREKYSPESGNYRKALYVTDPLVDRKKHLNLMGEIVQGTCQWILRDELFQQWLENDPPMLWLSGGPGSGKTYISIFLAEHFQSQGKIVIDFYCDAKIKGRNTATDLLRGIIHRILDQRPETMKHFESEYHIKGDSIFQDFTGLWIIFVNMLRDLLSHSNGQVYCVLDALDECGANSARLLTFQMNQLLSEALPKRHKNKFKVLLASREPDFLEHRLSSAVRIRLDGEMHNDLEMFIKARMDEAFPNGNPGWREKVERYIILRAGGTFLWAGFAMQMVATLKSVEVLPTLEELPTGLSDMYACMLQNIGKGYTGRVATERRRIALLVLKWVVMAVRPLKLLEVYFIIKAPASCKYEIKHGEMEMQEALDYVGYCGDLLVVDKDRDDVYMVHQSLKDYFLSSDGHIPEDFQISAYEANEIIAVRCVTYLSFNLKPKLRHADVIWGSGSFGIPDYRGFYYTWDDGPWYFEYAAEHWLEHAVPLNETVWDHSLPLLQPGDSSARNRWYAYGRLFEEYDSDEEISKNKAYSDNDREYFYGRCDDPDRRFPHLLLHTLADVGLCALARAVIQQQSFLNMPGFNAEDCTDQKSKQMFKQVFLNMYDKHGYTAMMYAAMAGETSFVEFLIDEGADVNLKASCGGKTALSLAYSLSRNDVVKLLLQRGARDVHPIPKRPRSESYSACSKTEIMKRLEDQQKIRKDVTPAFSSKDQADLLNLLQANLWAGPGYNLKAREDRPRNNSSDSEFDQFDTTWVEGLVNED